MPESAKPVPRFFRPPLTAPLCGLVIVVACLSLAVADVKEAGRELNRQAQRLFALSEFVLTAPSPGLADDPSSLEKWLEAASRTPPFKAARLITADGAIIKAGPDGAFDEPTGLVLPGYPTVRYGRRVSADGAPGMRLELLADSRPLAAGIALRVFLASLVAVCALWLTWLVMRGQAVAPVPPALGEPGEAHFDAPPPQTDDEASPKASEPPRGTEPSRAARTELRAVMPLRLRPLAPLFIKTTFDNARRMRAGLAQEDYETVRRLGHSLKGAARTYGLMDLGERGYGLEKAASDKDAGRLAVLLDELDDALSRTRVYFEERKEAED